LEQFVNYGHGYEADTRSTEHISSFLKNWRPFFSHHRLQSDDLFSCPIWFTHCSFLIQPHFFYFIWVSPPWRVSPGAALP